MIKRSRLRKQVQEANRRSDPLLDTLPPMMVGAHRFPAFSGIDQVCGASLAAYPPYKEIPEEFRKHSSKFNDIASNLFFRGGKLSDFGIDLRPGINRTAAFATIRALLGSFEPKHEHKEATIAWCLSEWTHPIAEASDQ